jgi:serpin B
MINRSYLKAILVGCLVLAGLMGCGKLEGLRAKADAPLPEVEVAQRDQQTAEQSTTLVDPRVVSANTNFGFKLFSQLIQEQPDQNVVISPSSVAIALSMTYNGANGETQKAMVDTLALQDVSLEDLNRANADLENILENADPAVQVAIANSLWGRQDITFHSEFLQRNQNFYNAEIATLDFTDPAAVATINDWVNQRTAGKIPQIIDEIDPDDVLYLINAIYFKGSWTEEFDPSRTSDRPFTLLDGTQKQHPMMIQGGKFDYAETEQFQAIELPYGEGRMSMYVFLPRETYSLSEFQQILRSDNWDNWMRQFTQREGSLELPRFKFEYGNSLNDALKALGMSVAFEPNQADFSGMSDTKTFINNVQHKTFIEVNEEGTEAAASTSVGISITSAQLPQDPFEMRVDRPFFFAIRDNQSGTVLFMGSIVNPE